MDLLSNCPATARSPRSVWRSAHFQIAGILAVGVCLIVSLWLIVVVAIETERSAAIEHASSEANNLSAAFQAEVTGKLDATTRLMDMIAHHVRARPGFNFYTWGQEHQELINTNIQAAALLSVDGSLLSTTREPDPAPRDLSGRDYFRAHLDGSSSGPFIGRLVIEELSGEPGIAVSRRVEAADGRFLGVLVVKLAPDQLTVLHKAADLGPRTFLSLIGSDNIIRARFGPGSEDGHLGVGEPVPAPFPAGESSTVHSSIRTAVVDQVTRLYSSRALAGYPLFVSVAFDLAGVLRPAAEHARTIEAIGLFASVMLGGLILLLAAEIRRRADREAKLTEEQARLAAEILSGRAIQAQLRSSEQRLRDFATTASDWFWEQDADLRFTEIGVENPLFAPDDRSHIGKCRWEINDTSQAPELWADHQRDLLARKPFRSFSFSLLGHDGRLHHISLNGIPVYDESGAFIGYRGTGRDITAEAEAETKIREAKERAEQAETWLRDAVDSMSEGFVIYDHEDRLIMCNERFLEAYGRNSEDMVPGETFENIVRRGLARGDFADAMGREEEWFRERVAHFRRSGPPVERQLTNGRWILVTDRRMRSGGMTGLRVDITTLKQAQAALAQSEARLDRAQAIAGIGSWELDIASGRYEWSKELFRIRGVSPEEFEPTVANVASYVHADDYPALRRWLFELTEGRGGETREVRIVRPGGEIRLLSVEGRAVSDADGIIRHLAGTMQDITDRRLVERQFSQAQKMEAIGRLTGGMAHDFNNGLCVIIGNLDLLELMVEANGTAVEVCGEAREAASRCADLIRGLLAFARSQPLHPRQIDVNMLVRDTARLLDRTLGEDISLNLTLDAGLGPVLADPSQLEAALVNLATNARDAMPRGGKLRILTRNAKLDSRHVGLHPPAVEGDYVLIEVSDTGSGIAPEIVGRIFEPFFTTKEAGYGTGLGLAMVFGFVKQSGGHLDVYSEPGLGTTFKIYLPRAVAKDMPAAGPVDRRRVIGGNETILVVEDHAHLRQLAVRHLAGLGYRVIEAKNAETAQRIFATERKIDLLFTDLVMPGAIDGIGLARSAARMRPRLKILLTSGFPGTRTSGEPDSPSGFRLLAKPYNREELARAVRETLGETGVEAPAPGHGEDSPLIVEGSWETAEIARY